ncbi:uroporphyrin-III C-m [Fomitiporia mediterranea MF3/22]|uniref:uroporphyrin-III C-m n=1 Tax=Fomitiporia mediterranea (strain MF3/22) TaxID=694068 RepID=UPI0004409576|nr:uroporphyrin-III C-m [Fomitiporia mediterranea MF3/22]EJC98621.1 uroporphyrin-III C-m [Fomitiporia mediterranea MF3/22]
MRSGHHTSFTSPQRGASLMLAFRPKLTVVIGSNRLAATRAFAALEADSAVVILARGGFEFACEELQWRSTKEELEILDLDEMVGQGREGWDAELAEALALEKFLDSQSQGSVSLVFITDTLINADTSERRSRRSASQLYDVCRERNIPVNVTDMSDLCDFTVCATHRFVDGESGDATSLQVGITTNGQGCRLAARLKREVVARLPNEVGGAVEKVGRLRRLAKTKDQDQSATSATNDGVQDAENELNEEITVTSPNRPVEQRSPRNLEVDESEMECLRRRMKWVAQISEYWSLAQLAGLTDVDMERLLAGDLLSTNSSSPGCPFAISPPSSQHDLIVTPPPQKEQEQGCVLLVGSGPGHPSLLTLAAHSALTSQASLILADKLVPSAVLSLIPQHIEVRIARKFPGNADGAQQELMDLALAAARSGRTVVRLKQGDPALFGRVGEEVLFLRKHGVKVLVIPGISSALAAPLFANIPVTQRGAADSLVVCTGVGRGGAKGRVPGYERARTVVLLMGVARLESLVNSLLSGDSSSTTPYPPYVPCAIIERASMPDQRVISAPLRDINAALESAGEQRPPGLLVIGWAVLSLHGEGDMSVLDECNGIDENGKEVVRRDLERVERWLEGRRWRVSEGIDRLWDTFKVPGLDS